LLKNQPVFPYRGFSVVLLSGFLMLSIQAFTHTDPEPVFEVKMPRNVIRHIPAEIEIFFPDFEKVPVQSVEMNLDDTPCTIELKYGVYSWRVILTESTTLNISSKDHFFSASLTPVPLWMSILAPLIAILIALVFREVFVALFLGIWTGSFILAFYQGYSVFSALFFGFFAIIHVYIIESLNDTAHLSIIVFSMLIGAMVMLISDNGGMKGVVNFLSRYARSARSGQLITWILGISIFFDDYANTLVVGNTMRPVTDRLKISREKLSYIVDSTAAPIAAIAFVTTWIGAELSYIQDGIRTLNLDESPYDVFLKSLQYSFYPLLALAFLPILIFSRRDFGPMYKAEKRLKTEGIPAYHPAVREAEQKSGREKERWFNAVIPVAVVILGTITGLITTGLQSVAWEMDSGFLKNLSNVIGQSDSFRALLWASLAGAVAAVLLTVTQRIMTLKESIESLVSGFRTMLTAVLILVLAWSIALLTQHMHTADFISGLLIQVRFTPYLIPSVTFILAALVAFSTGTSWGTMAILYPLILPSSWILAREFGLNYDQTLAIFHNVVACVLAGSVLGDHCSPISDTTILSSLSSSCNHIEHVRTQLPYALIVGLVATLLGTIPSAYGVPFWIVFPLCLAVLIMVVRVFGRKTIQK
jgi:Na+/H+ antiporter NhaC